MADLDEIIKRRAMIGQPGYLVSRHSLLGDIDTLLAELRATEGDLGVAVQVAAERADQAAELRAFAAWLIAMDDPEDVIGREDRRSVTLTQIIERARFAVGAATGTKGDDDERD